MKLLHLSSALAAASTVAAQGYEKLPGLVYATNNVTNITWVGEEHNGVEVFLGVQYGVDTCGENRFKPPVPVKLEPNTQHDARTPGPACPQPLGQWHPPLTLGNIQKTSEDCLNLNIWRPVMSRDTKDNFADGLPVMIWIHGGALWAGSNMEPSTDPSKMIVDAIPNSTYHLMFPVIHVAINYRLGVFGFAQSEALRKEGSENAGLRDQRLAIEWVIDNIGTFGGDKNNIIVAGQGSGALSATMQHLAYGGQKSLPIKSFVVQSGALEPGITGNYTINAMKAVVQYSGCNTTSDVNHPDAIKCLRSRPYQSLVNDSVPTYRDDGTHNLGDVWLPSVDSDFLPGPPSQLLKEGKFSAASFLIGWTDSEVPAVSFQIHEPDEVFKYVAGFITGIPYKEIEVINDLLKLYPVEEFTLSENLSSQFYRLSRIIRDAMTVCPSLYLAQAINKGPANVTDSTTQGSPVYLYHFNYTILEPAFERIGVPNLGKLRSSDIPFVFDTLDKYEQAGYASNFTVVDTDLAKRTTLSWSSFAASNGPTFPNTGTLQGWNAAYASNGTGLGQPIYPGGAEAWLNNTAIYVIGGPREGLSAIDGEWSYEELRVQRLRERCNLLNSDKWVKYLQY
ncbi:alpha/beta-hydrolase, partial [Lophiostoma macrostomum CBS 122681]